MAPGLRIRLLPSLMWFSSELTSDVSSSLSSGCLTMYPFDRDLHFSLLVRYRCQILNLVACVSHSNDSSVKKSHQGDLKRKRLHSFVWRCFFFCFVFTPSTFWLTFHTYLYQQMSAMSKYLNAQIQLTGNVASTWGRRNAILCFVRQLRERSLILTCIVGVCSAYPAGLLFFLYLSFLFSSSHGINPGDENVMEQVHFAKRFWLPCSCNWLFQGQGEI